MYEIQIFTFNLNIHLSKQQYSIFSAFKFYQWISVQTHATRNPSIKLSNTVSPIHQTVETDQQPFPQTQATKTPTIKTETYPRHVQLQCAISARTILISFWLRGRSVTHGAGIRPQPPPILSFCLRRGGWKPPAAHGMKTWPPSPPFFRLCECLPNAVHPGADERSLQRPNILGRVCAQNLWHFIHISISWISISYV